MENRADPSGERCYISADSHMSYYPRLEARASGSPIPLTAAQKCYWHGVAKTQANLSPFRVGAAFLRLSGAVDVSRLEQGVVEVIAGHESLRTRIALLNGEPTQIVDAARRFELSLTDLSRGALDERELLAKKLGKEFLQEKIDITVGPLFDARIFRLSPEDHVLILAVDHIVSDAISFSIITREVVSGFREGGRGLHRTKAGPRVQFPDYAVWQHSTQVTWMRDHEAYWRSRLSNMQKIEIPREHQGSDSHPQESSELYIPFGRRLTAGLREIAKQEGCLLPLIVLSQYLILMSKWCERRDLLVAFVSHGRQGHSALKDVIGCFAYSMYLRVEVVPSESLRELVRRVIAEFQSALFHDASRVGGTLFLDEPTEIFFNWLTADWAISGTYPAEDVGSGVQLRPFAVRKGVNARFMPYFMDTPSGIVTAILYRRDMFSNSVSVRFAGQLKWLAEKFVGSPEARLDSLEFDT